MRKYVGKRNYAFSNSEWKIIQWFNRVVKVLGESGECIGELGKPDQDD